MHHKIRIFVLTAVLFVLFGCQVKPESKEGGKPSVTNPVETKANNLGTTLGKLDDKSENVENKEAERDGKILADANAAQHANQNNPEGVPKEQVDSHITVLKSRLGNAKEDPKAMAEAAERDRLFEAGKAAEARAATDKAVKDATAQAGELALAKQEVKQVREELGGQITSLKSEIGTLKVTIQNNQIENQKAINKALDEERKAMTRKITWGLVIGSVVLMAVGAFLAYSKFNMGEPVKAAIAAGFWGGAAGFCATFAWAINQEWFQQFVKWMVIGGGTIGLIAGVIYVVSELRSAREKKALVETAKSLDKDATEADSTLLKVYDVVEHELGDDSATFGRLLTALTGKLNDNEKAYINELKALRQRAKAAGAPAAV